MKSIFVNSIKWLGMFLIIMMVGTMCNGIPGVAQDLSLPGIKAHYTMNSAEVSPIATHNLIAQADVTGFVNAIGERATIRTVMTVETNIVIQNPVFGEYTLTNVGELPIFALIPRNSIKWNSQEFEPNTLSLMLPISIRLASHSMQKLQRMNWRC